MSPRAADGGDAEIADLQRLQFEFGGGPFVQVNLFPRIDFRL